MTKLSEIILRQFPATCFTISDVAVLVNGTDNKRYSLLKRAMAQKEIIKIRRGLYCLSPNLTRKRINPLTVAQYVYGPSYISQESALSIHGCIPEAVFAVTSTSMDKSRVFNSPLGIFLFRRVPQQTFYASVERRSDQNNEFYLLASPLKALADFVYCRQKNWKGLKPLIEDLRIDFSILPPGSSEEYGRLMDNYRSRRVCTFLKTLQEDMN